MERKFLRVMDTFATLLVNLVFYVIAGIGLYALFCWTYKQGEEENHLKGQSITVVSNGHDYIIFVTDNGETCCTHSASCQCLKKNSLWKRKS